MRYLIGCTAILLLLYACDNQHQEQLTIATAANAQYAMQTLTDSFEKQYGISCNVVTGSSGQLTAQITEGAPYDVFVAANMKYPEALYNKHLSAAPPKVYAYGRLVLWTTNHHLPQTMDALTDSAYQHIAVADPLNAPYGQAAVECLQHFNVFNKVKDKLVYGTSVSQTNQYIVSGNVEVGFTAKSVVLAETMKHKGQWMDVPDEAYTPPAQGAIVIKSSPHPEKAQKFYNFLFSKDGKAILTKYGYKPAEQ